MKSRVSQKSFVMLCALSVAACATMQASRENLREPDTLSKVRPLLKKPVQVTVGNDANLGPDLSSDGRYLVFTTSINGNKEVVLRDRQKGRQTRLTWHPADDFSPVLSPDKSKAAFITRRRDAAGDVAVVATSGFTSGVLSEREVQIAYRPESEDLTPAWWPDGNSLLVPTKSSQERVPRLRKFDLKTNTWSDWGQNQGDFPQINASGERIIYVRAGKIYVNRSEGVSERELESLLGGMWSRPRFVTGKNEIVAIRYHHDTNRDGRVDGADAGTVWSLKTDEDFKVVTKAEQLTSASYNSFIPELRTDGLFATIQAKGALEIFKFPQSGQGRAEWLDLPEDRWLSHLTNTYDRVFALNYVALNSPMMSPSQRKQAAFNHLRAIQELSYASTAADVSLFGQDMLSYYPGDPSVELMVSAFNAGVSVKDDLKAFEVGKAGAASRRRVAHAVEKLKSISVQSNTLSKGLFSTEDLKGLASVLAAQILRDSGKPEQAIALIKQIPKSSQKRFQDEATLVEADAVGDLRDNAAKEAVLKDLLSRRSAANDIQVEAARRIVQSLQSRNPTNDELNLIRQQTASLPILPPLLHELTAKRFLAEKKDRIAIQEYRQILVDHCKEDAAVTLQLASTYVDIGVVDGASDEVDRSLAKMAGCIKDLEVESTELAVLRSQTLVKRGLILMKEREYGVALKVFRDAVAQDSQNLAAWRGVIDASFQRKILPEILFETEKRYKNDPESGSAAYAYGYALSYKIDLASGAYSKISAIDDSIELIEKSKDLLPSNIYPYQTLGWLHMQKGHSIKRLRSEGGLLGKASALVAKARELFGRPEEDQIELGVDSFLAAIYLAEEQSLEKANLLQNLGEAYYELENHQKALLHLGERMQMAKTIPFGNQNAEASVYRLAGRSAFQIDELDLAESIQRRGLELWQAGGNDQQISYSMDALALTLRERKKYPQAIAVYDALRLRHLAAKRGLEMYRTVANIGYCKYMNGNLEAALKDFEDSQAGFDDLGSDANAANRGGGIAVDVGGQGSAAKGFDQSGLQNMNLTFMARINEELKQYDKAVDLYTAKINLLDKLAEDKSGGARTAVLEEKLITRNNRALTLIESGRLSDAKAELRTAVLEARDLKAQSAVSMDEVLNLAIWARVELRLVALGLSTGETYEEAKARIEAIGVTVNEEIEKGGSRSKWEPMAAKLRLLQSALSLASSKENKDTVQEIAQSILNTASTFAVTSLGSLPRQREYAAAAYELNLMAATGGLKDAMKELRRSAVSAASGLPAWHYSSVTNSAELAALEALEGEISDGFVLGNQHEVNRSLKVFSLAFDQSKDDLQKTQLVRRVALLFLNSFENALKTGDENSKSEVRLTGIQTEESILGKISSEDYLMTVLDWNGVYRSSVFDGKNKRWIIQSQADSKFLLDRARGISGSLYFTCYGKRCEDLRRNISSVSRRMAVLASIEQIPKILSMRRIAKSAVSFLGQRFQSDEVEVKRSLAGQDVGFLDGADWRDVSKAASSSHMLVLVSPFRVGHEKPWNGAFWSNNSYKWPLLGALKTKTWYNTAVVIPSVVTTDKNVDPMMVYSFLSSWFEQQGVPMGYVGEISSPISSQPKTILEAASEVQKIVMGAGPQVIPGYVNIGDPGLSNDEAILFAKQRLGVTKENALDARDDGDYATAKRHYLEALQYAELLKLTDETLALSDALVKTLFVARDYQAAYHFQKQRVDLLRSSGASEETLAWAEMEAGILATRSGLGFVARQHLTKSEEFYKKDDDDEKQAQVQHYVALSYEADGDFEKTVKAYFDAKTLYDKAGFKKESAQKLLDIGNVYKERLSNLPMALDYYERAYEGFQKAGQTDRLSSVLIDRANTLMAMGETKLAITLLEGQVLKQVDPKQNPTLWIRAAQIAGVAYYQAGMYQESQDYISKIRVEIASLPNETAKASAAIDADNLYGMNLEKLGQHAQASVVFDGALKRSRTFGLRGKEAMLLNNIGFWMREAGEVSASLSYFQLALAIDTELKSEADQAYDLRNMAMSWTLLGDLTQASAAANNALAMSHRLKLAHNEAYSLFALAEISLKQSRPEEAIKQFLQAKEIASKAYLQDFVWRADAAAASVQASLGRYEDAAKNYVAAVTLIESLRAGLAGESSRTGFASDRGVQDVYQGVVKAFMNLGKTEEAWVFSERGRARAFIDALGSKAQSFGDPDLDRAMENVSKLRSELEVLDRRLSLVAAATPEWVQVSSEKAKKFSQREQEVSKLLAKWPNVASFLSVQKMERSILAKHLHRDAALLEYMILGDQTAYWLIYGDRIEGGLLPIGRSKLTPLIDQYRELMQNFAAVQATAEDLSTAILKVPLGKITDSQIKELVIVPHSELHYVPFASLPVGSGYLLDRFAISYLESAEMTRFFPLKPRKISKDSKLAAFANPDRGADLDLPFAVREVQAIQRSFPHAVSVFGATATKSKFKEMSANTDLLHFAGHGEFVEADAAASRLLFANEQDLTVKEILELRMPTALVTLSACETGLGKLSSGDEMVGFNRALFFAGAESVVSSLWRVSDVASAVTIKRFYASLAKGDTRSQALRKAQLVVRDYYNHPAYWSSFKLSGMRD